MSWKNWILSASAILAAGNHVLAKPADLPVDQTINLAADPAPQGQVPNAYPLPVDPSPAEPAVPDEPREAQRMFETAERQLRAGRINDARRGYQETHLMAPNSRSGRTAMQRLGEIEAPANDFSEEQEPPLNRPNFDPRPETKNDRRWKPNLSDYLEMLRRTRPLGTHRQID